MRKVRVLSVVFTLLIIVSGCSDKNRQETINRQEKQIERLTHEKKELELLLENEKQKVSATTSQVNEIEYLEMDNGELVELFETFIYAQFEREYEVLKQVTTANLYTVLVDKAGEYDTSVSFKSVVKSITLYQAEVLNDADAKMVGKIEIETTVGDFAPHRYQQLVECTALKSTEGIFQIDTQILTNLV